MVNVKKHFWGIVLVILGILLILFGIFMFNHDDISQKKPVVDTSKEAKKILENLSIDDFLAIYFDNSVELNKNLLDVSLEKEITYYFLANDNIEKYILVFDNPNNSDMTYIKYDDFIKEFKNIFNASEPAFSYKNTTMDFPNLVKNENGKYVASLEGVRVCDFSNNTDNCYVLVGGSEVSKNQSVEFSKLKMNDNLITGNVKKYYDINDKRFYIDGSFEFEFEKNDNRYIIKSFKLTKVNEQ